MCKTVVVVVVAAVGLEVGQVLPNAMGADGVTPTNALLKLRFVDKARTPKANKEVPENVIVVAVVVDWRAVVNGEWKE